MLYKKNEEFKKFSSKKTRQGNGTHSKPRKGKKMYRGQGK
tara:strand:+ start:822 stop:941 length:120 start_codon:yes stop_codon:yes gene_type:complete